MSNSFLNRNQWIDCYFVDSEGYNPSDAYRLGSVIVMGLAAHVLVNLLCFVSLMDFPNSTLAWMGERVGVPGFTLEASIYREDLVIFAC